LFDKNQFTRIEPMITDKKNGKRVQSGGCAIHCQDCSISQLCIPFSLNDHELDQLDNIIERKKPIQKGEALFKAGDELKSLYAIRSGTIKSYTITEQGDEQITGFHLAGDLIGFDAIHKQYHPHLLKHSKHRWSAKFPTTPWMNCLEKCLNCGNRSCV